MSERIVHTPSANRLIRLRNRTCAYCGAQFNKTLAHTDEHVIGRKFVPKGSLAGRWNLVVFACKKCNDEKCDLENDISVISMLPESRLPPNEIDPLVATEISRKSSGSISRRTGKPVIDSAESIQLKAQFGAASITLGFTCPPQIDQSRICELARFHVQAFVYKISFDTQTRTGRFLFGDFHLWSVAPYSDWGSLKMRWFAGQIQDWLPKLRADGAEGFFRIHIRRHKTLEVISWALEWNKGMRVVGFAGAPDEIASIVSSCPVEKPRVVHDYGSERLIFREHVALADEDDLLFSWQGFET